MELIVFAGGLGSRLNNTEKLPKPLVPINGKSMLTLIIKEYDKSFAFDKYNILISADEELYVKWKNNEMNNYNIEIVNECKRTGRTGALKYFLSTKKDLKAKSYAIANGDTLLTNLEKKDIIKCMKLNEKKNKPTALMLAKDKERNDAKCIQSEKNIYVNSGFIVINSSWIENIKDGEIEKDIDEIIFLDNKYLMAFSNCQMVDIGTPDRLQGFRELLT